MLLPVHNTESFCRCKHNYNQKIQDKKLFIIKKGSQRKHHYLKVLQITQTK